MMDWTKGHIERLGGKANLVANPVGTADRALPPILLGEFVVDPKKKTVCVYGHLDVQPAAKEDGWNTDPFNLVEKDGKLYGRGSTDDKGPALSWLWIVEAHQQLGVELPVNIKICYEGMEEFGSDGLFELIRDESKPGKFLNDVVRRGCCVATGVPYRARYQIPICKFFHVYCKHNVTCIAFTNYSCFYAQDFFCISDNYWIGKTKPCLTYGLRGMAYFQLTVDGCRQDLHSGVVGGTVHEAMTDLVKLMGSLVDSNGEILVNGVMDSVKPVTPEEEALYDGLDFDLAEFKEEQGANLIQNDKKSLLMARWRYPTLSLHGIEGAFSGKGAKTVIPAKVIGKFSMRLVPDQDSKQIEKLVSAHLEKEFAKVRFILCFFGT